MRTLAELPTLVSWLCATAKMALPLGSLSENCWPRARRILMPRMAAKRQARSIRMAAWSLVLEIMTMLWSLTVRAWWRAFTAMVVVLPHWRLQHRIRYLASRSSTWAWVALGWKLRADLAHSETFCGSGVGTSGISASGRGGAAASMRS